MLKNYTIEFSKRSEHKDYNLVQYTLNKFQTAVARNTFDKLANWGSNQKVVVHMDYIKTFTRFPIMKQSIRDDLVAEIATILLASNTDILRKYTKGPIPEILGVVIHSDSPIKSAGMADLFNNGIPKTKDSMEEFCSKYWNSPFFDTPNEIVKELEQIFLISNDVKSFITNYYTHALVTMAFSVQEHIYHLSPGTPITGKIFIENTTKVPLKEGINFVEFLRDLSRQNKLTAFCFDEEHSYACADDTLINYQDSSINLDFLDTLKSTDLVHLNTIPSEVGYGSYLDRHSHTTIFNSKASPEVYFQLSQELQKRNINYVREVKLVQEELQLIKDYEDRLDQ